MERDSIIFYRSFYEAIKELPRDVQGEIYTAIMEYGLFGRETEHLKPIARSIFTLVKPQLDANTQRYLNGTQGGAPSGNQNAKKTTEKQPRNNQKQPNVKENVNVNVNDKDIPPIPPKGGEGVKKFIKPTLSEIQEYCKSRSNGVNPAEFLDFYEAKGWMIGKNKMKDWRAAVRTWENKNNGSKQSNRGVRESIAQADTFTSTI